MSKKVFLGLRCLWFKPETMAEEQAMSRVLASKLAAPFEELNGAGSQRLWAILGHFKSNLKAF